MSTIQKVAVFGSGVMGASIAAHFANSGTPVLLFDIVPEGASDRSVLARTAIEKLLKADPAPLTHKRLSSLITPANIEDDLGKLSEVDWIVEAVLERLDIKQNLYKKLEEKRKKNSVVSSNTSTIPLHTLTQGLSENFKKDFLVTHFFNPPRYMRLLELVAGEKTRSDIIPLIKDFAEKKLGKGVVACKDTPGFLANRIGIFWMTSALLRAIEMNIPVEEADAIMGKPVGIPKTGVFGLFDLIGIDLMPLIAKAFEQTLPANDAFRSIYKEPALITRMISEGYTGRKGKGGFYRINKEGGKKNKEAIDLATGDYRPVKSVNLESVEGAKSGLNALVEHPDRGGKYARAVLLDTLSYTASLVPEIAEDIRDIDEAMRLGYNWKYGPFELIDRLATSSESGAAWLASALKKENRPVPPLLEKIGNQAFYKNEISQRFYFIPAGQYGVFTVANDAWTLKEKTYGQKPILKNPSAKLWDIGDGIACLEYTSKMNSVDPMTLDLIAESVEKVKSNFRGLVIGNDGDNFCVGANIGVLLFAANCAAWKTIEEVIKRGQDVYAMLKFAPFPVVAASSGMALGGGCELLLHSDSVQAHVETYTGLVEAGVGLIPGWGGCKELIIRNIAVREKEKSATAALGRMFRMLPLVKSFNTMPAVIRAFEQIALAKVSKSAEEMREMNILRDSDRITMNRARVLPDAKARCLELVPGYKAPEQAVVYLPGKTARTALEMAIRGFEKQGKATPHDAVIARHLAYVLSGGNTSIHTPLNEDALLKLELEAFMELIKTRASLDRLEHMLETGKPLRN